MDQKKLRKLMSEALKLDGYKSTSDVYNYVKARYPICRAVMTTFLHRLEAEGVITHHLVGTVYLWKLKLRGSQYRLKHLRTWHYEDSLRKR